MKKMNLIFLVTKAIIIGVATSAFADTVVTNPVDAVRRALPAGWVIQRVETNSYPSYRPKGNGTAIFLVIDGKKYSKQNHSAVVHLMASDYRDGGEDPTHGAAQSWPAMLVATTDNSRIYLWPGPQAEDWRSMQNDLLKVLITTEGQ